MSLVSVPVQLQCSREHVSTTPTPENSPASEPPRRRPVPPPPTRRGFVHIPALVFFGFDTVLLLVAGRPAGSAIVLAGATAVLIGWVLDRRYRRVASRWEHARRSDALEALNQLNQLTNQNDSLNSSGPTPSAIQPPTQAPVQPPIRPPVGSWANPSASQRFRSRWDRSMPFARRSRRR